MKASKVVSRGLLAAAALSFSALALAAPCTGSLIPPVLNTSDVNYSATGIAPFVDANACFGYQSDNDNATNVNTLASASSQGWGGGFLLADKTDSVGSAVSLFGGNFTFTLTAAAGTPGTYSLSATDGNGAGTSPDFPFLLDFIAVLKGGPGFAGWFFDDVIFDGSGGGQWAINFLNNGGNEPGLSHFSVYVREGSSSSSSSSGLASSSGQIPEPGSTALVLLGLGLVGSGLLSRRRSRGA